MTKKYSQTLREELIASYQEMVTESLVITKEWEQIGDAAWLKAVSPVDNQKLIVGLCKGGEVDAGDEPRSDQ